MKNNKTSKLERWRAKYGAIAIALLCFYTTVTDWGDNWILTGITSIGVVVCGTLGYFDIKRDRENKISG